MTMAWIERVENRSSRSLELSQTDPTWHPVSNGRQYASGERIVVAPGMSLDFSYFVVPWTGYGNLVVTGPGGTTTWNVGPRHDRNDGQDYLYGIPQTGAAATEIHLGPPGNQFQTPSKRYTLIATDAAVRFEPRGTGAESTIFNAVAQAFRSFFGF